ncbi:MAG: hypothetical protein AAF411_28070, partial [Myxococcota bacterium]
MQRRCAHAGELDVLRVSVDDAVAMVREMTFMLVLAFGACGEGAPVEEPAPAREAVPEPEAEAEA